MKWLILIVGIVIGLTGILLFLQTKDRMIPVENAAIKPTVLPTQPVNYTASFMIFTNGTQRIFTDPRYHNLSPEVYLEPTNSHIIHVKTTVTWNEFFKTLPMSLTKDCLVTGTKQTFCTNKNETLKFYINGRPENNALDMIIKPNDWLLVSFGNEDEEEIKKQLDILSDFKVL